MSSVYDPLGLLSPYILRAKMFFQLLCKQGCDWDDAMPNDIAELWQRWLSDLPQLTNFSILQFHANLLITWYIILLTDRRTDKLSRPKT